MEIKALLVTQVWGTKVSKERRVIREKKEIRGLLVTPESLSKV